MHMEQTVIFENLKQWQMHIKQMSWQCQKIKDRTVVMYKVSPCQGMNEKVCLIIFQNQTLSKIPNL